MVKHGDPRQSRDFDSQRFLANQRREFRLQRELQELRRDLAGMKQRIAEAPAVSRSLQKQGQKFLKKYRELARRDPQELTAELQASLREVESFLAERPDVFRAKPTEDDAINDQLAAIGDYELDLDREYPTISWRNPPGLDCAWTHFELSFMVVLREGRRAARGTNAPQMVAAYSSLVQAWEQFRPRFGELEPHLTQYVLDLFRTVEIKKLDPETRSEFKDSSGEITDEAILGHVQSGSILFTFNDEQVQGPEISFDVDWDLEHGVEIEFDADGEISRWF